MNSTQKTEVQVEEFESGLRLDQLIHQRFPEFSRTFFQKLIELGHVTVNRKKVKVSYKVSTREKICIYIPHAETTAIIPENLTIDIIYEDRDIIVINKPAGMIVHPGAGVRNGTLVNALLYHCQDLSGIGGRLRPGIVHRLDKETSGLLIAAKNDSAHLGLTRQLSEKQIRREYLAIVWHRFSEKKGTIETYLARSKRNRKLFTVSQQGRKAITHYVVEKPYEFLTAVRVQLETGRTHQIRVHFNHIHHPVFGDPSYNGRIKQLGQLARQEDKIRAKKLLALIHRQALHASGLCFLHPRTLTELKFESSLPGDMSEIFRVLNQNNF